MNSFNSNKLKVSQFIGQSRVEDDGETKSLVVGQSNFKGKTEAVFAKALGKVVSVLNRTENEKIKNINSHFIAFLEARDELINEHNLIILNSKVFLNMSEEAHFNEMKEMHSEQMNKSKNLSNLSLFFLKGIRRQLNEAKGMQREVLATKITERIEENINKLNHSNLRPEDIKGIKKQIAFDRQVVETLLAADSMKLAEGKAKEIYKAGPFTAKQLDDPDLQDVILVAKNEFGRQEELDRETRHATRANEYVAKNQGDGVETNIVKMRPVAPEDPEYSPGQSKIRSDEADGDLKDLFKNGFTFEQSFEMAFQVLNGMSNLHEAGLLHGDIKDDNILFFEKNGEYIMRVTDFGKTKEFEKGESFIYQGNYRFAPPEGRLSEKGEVFSTALMMIRILENELLQDGKKTVIDPTHVDDQAHQGDRTGIELFLIMNKDCSQNEKTSFKPYVKVVKNELRSFFGLKSKPKLQANEKEIQRYINSLIEQLSKKHPENSTQIKQMGNLLIDMTRNESQRMEHLSTAKAEFKKIMERNS
ncbi:MAG: protein kinase [Parachlamydia sp.]|jgi:serine/threonine protein kinase|nr:protein kinase [Parachlamydia sp.]